MPNSKILYDAIEIVELIKTFEQDDKKHLKHLIKKNRYAQSKNFNLSPANKILLELIVNLKNTAPAQFKKLLKSTLQNLQQIEQTHLYSILTFSYWLKQRINEVN